MNKRVARSVAVALLLVTFSSTVLAASAAPRRHLGVWTRMIGWLEEIISPPLP